MQSPGSEQLELIYTRGDGEDREQVRQTIRLIYTVPHFGGKRWWMVCPYRGHRVGKLYLPPWGDRFASRKAWQLGYKSQRDHERDKAFSRLERLQAKLGCEPGYDMPFRKPKGMWQRTWLRHLERYEELDFLCAAEMMAMLGRIGRA